MSLKAEAGWGKHLGSGRYNIAGFLRKEHTRTGEMAQQLGALTACPGQSVVNLSQVSSYLGTKLLPEKMSPSA